MMRNGQDKPIMRCLGEFVGYIFHAVIPNNRVQEVNRKVEERVEGNLTFRRTTIDEIEVREERGDDD